MKKICTSGAVYLRLFGSGSFFVFLNFSTAYADSHDDLLSISPASNSVPATIISLQNSWVSAEIAANIDSLYADVGNKVEKDSLLAKLDCREFTIRQDQAQADVNSLKAKLPGIRATIEAAKSDVAANNQTISLFNTQAKAAHASVNASKANANRIKAQSQAEQAQCRLAGLDLKRAKDLGKRQVISQQEVDQAESAFQAAQAGCNAIEPELKSAYAKTQSLQASASAAEVATKVQQAKTRMADSNIKVREAEIPALNAQIAAAEAKLQTESLMVSRCDLKAPFTGEIVEREVQLGQRIGIGEKAFRLISLLDREISSSMSELELKSITSAQSLFFSTPFDKLPIQFRAAVGILNGEARTREVRFTFIDDTPLPVGTSGRIVWEK